MHPNDWFSRVRLADGIDMLTEPYVHPYMRANIYHLRGRDRDLVVDTGMGLADLRAALDLTPGKPVLAFATHIHLDHVGSLHAFAERAGPSASADSFATMPDCLTYADWFRTMEDPVERTPAADWRAADYRLHPAPLTLPLDEGDVVDLGDRCFTVLHLPGHSPDSIALLDEADGLFFSGDAVYDDQLIDDLADSDRVAYRRTMARLMDLPIRLALGGHGPSFDRDRMRRIAREYLDRP
ncbi:Hydroxyacylglutathione hydrolase GloC [Rhizobiaceae bacterium]|nr:Hydroxyacylglutathione hydrolase GloC [Rhizobiaceae bacterium]